MSKAKSWLLAAGNGAKGFSDRVPAAAVCANRSRPPHSFANVVDRGTMLQGIQAADSRCRAAIGRITAKKVGIANRYAKPLTAITAVNP